MLKKILRRGLHALGLEVHRAPRPSFEPVDAAELRTLEEELRAFARAQPEVPTWSDPEKAREYLSERRLRFFHEVLDACARHQVPLEGRRVADIGSGTGYLLRLIHQRHPRATLAGFDTYRDITRLARHLCPAAAFHDRDLYDAAGERFDVVFCTEVLEHLLHPDQALHHLLGLLDDGGRLVLTVPDGRRDQFPAYEPLDNGRGYWGHINFWSPESWPLFLERAAPGWRRDCGKLATGENYAVLGR